MEEHRLNPMGEYDERLFNKLYKDLYPLKRKLASQIDYRRFGVTYEDLLSWFDVKFIHTFNKYHTVHKENVLRGHLISALSFFKNRILRVAYQEKYSQTIIDMSTLDNPDRMFKENPQDNSYELFKNLLWAFMEKKLSYEAYQVFQVDYNPPEYILTRMRSKNAKVPAPLVADYLGWPERAGTKMIKDSRIEIYEALQAAKYYFQAKEALIA
jgi:hypothetical protein